MSQLMLEDAGPQLAQLIDQARSGEEVTIVCDSTPIAKIVQVPPEEPKKLRPGFGSGKYALVYMADDFDAPLEDFKDYM